MPSAIAGLSRVTKRFDAVVALRDVSLSFEGGKVHALLGENGSGKSTSVKILSGALAPDEGTVEIDGHPVAFQSPRQAIDAGIATTYQDTALVSQLSVADNIVLGREPGRYGVIGRRTVIRTARRWLDEVGLDIDPRTKVGGLPIAIQQLVAIAKALSLDARLFIFDEPTAALTGPEVARLFELIDELRRKGLAVVYITHRLSEVERLADDITVLKDGTLVKTLPAAGVNEATIVPLMVGREVRDLFPEPNIPSDEVVLHAANLTSADGFVAVPEFTVHAGEIVGIAGLEGSGRSTVVRLLSGVDPCQNGIVRVSDKPLKGGIGTAIRLGVGYTPPDRRGQATVPTFSIGRSITHASLRRFSRLGVLISRRERAGAWPLIERLGIKPARLDASIRTLSGGNQQKVVLARMLCAGTRVLACDEPTAGVDVGARQEIYALLGELVRNGVGIVVSSSDMLELLGLTHRIIVMREGRISAEFDTTEASEEALMRAQLPERGWSSTG